MTPIDVGDLILLVFNAGDGTTGSRTHVAIVIRPRRGVGRAGVLGRGMTWIGLFCGIASIAAITANR